MPKRIGFIFAGFASEDNAAHAMKMAAIGKTERPAVAVHFDEELQPIEADVKALVELVREKRFIPKVPIYAHIQDGPHKKPRNIAIPEFWPDQCVHWMLMLEIEPLIMRGMYAYNCGSIPGRGTKYALDAVMMWLRDDQKQCVWCLKLDVARFYDSIDTSILKALFRTIIKDQDVLWLIDTIVDCFEKGVPIGCYTSQWFANFYLQALDHFIKETLHIPHYVRYMDDMILFSANKRQLLRARESIASELAKLKLSIKDNNENIHKTTWAIFKPRETGISFLGYRIFSIRVDPAKHRYKWVKILERVNMLRMARRIMRIYRKGYMSREDACAVVSYYGMARAGNNWRFECKRLRPYADVEKAKKVVSDADKERAAARKALRHL